MMTICNTLLLQNKSNFSYLRPGLFIMHYAWDAVVYLLEETNWPTCTNKFSILLSLSFYFKINRPATKQTLGRKDIIRLLLLPKALHLSQAMHRKTLCSDVQTLDKFLVYAAEFNIKNSYSVLPWWTNSTICSLFTATVCDCSWQKRWERGQLQQQVTVWGDVHSWQLLTASITTRSSGKGMLMSSTKPGLSGGVGGIKN